MIDLRDEHYPEKDGCHCGWNPDLVQGSQTWQQWRDHMSTSAERALAAERAATIEECNSMIAKRLSAVSGRCEFGGGLKRALAIVSALPRDRSGMDAALEARDREWAIACSEIGIAALATTNGAIRLDDSECNARREQREKDVAAVKFFCDGHRRQALSAEEAAAAILAQED